MNREEIDIRERIREAITHIDTLYTGSMSTWHVIKILEEILEEVEEEQLEKYDDDKHNRRDVEEA